MRHLDQGVELGPVQDQIQILGLDRDRDRIAANQGVAPGQPAIPDPDQRPVQIPAVDQMLT